MAILNQLLGTAIASYLCLSMGLVYTWPSSTINLFKSPETPLNRPMTQIEISFLGSIHSISAIVSFPVTGYLNDYWGRKKSCILLSLFQLISWSIVSCCYQVEVVITAVFLSGLSSGIILVVPMYIAEISQKSIRGSLGSCVMIFMTSGMIISHVLGGYMQYSIMNYTFLSLMLMGVLILNFMKESPIYLMKKGLETETAETIAHFRGVSVNSFEVDQELEIIRKILNPDLDAALPEEEKLRKNSTPKKLSLFQFLKKSRSTRRAFAVSLMLYTTTIFQGVTVIQVYARPIFEDAAPNISSTYASVLFVLLTMIASMIAAALMDRLGRRPLIILSSIGGAVCSFTLGTQIHLKWGPHWLTPLLMYIFCLVYFCGAGMVPYILIAEIFLPEVKSYLTMIAIEWTYVCVFTILFTFYPMVSAIGLGPVFYIFGSIGIAAAVLSAIFLPETKGLSVDVIQTKFETQW